MFESEKLKIHEGRLYGVYRAKVVDNKDPKKLGRVKVNAPSVYGDGIESPWCFGTTLVSGSNFGIYAIPPIGSFIWIMFEKGSPDYPIWIGSPLTKNDNNLLKKTRSGKARTVPNIYCIGTQKGNMIVLDDDEDGYGIRIMHKSGSSIALHNDGSISLNPSPGKKVYVDGIIVADAYE